jgi:hypothetical protein
MRRNPFQPGKIIEDPLLFAAREALLEDALNDILNCRHVFVIGDRGIGKSSFAKQLMLLLGRDSRALTRFRFAREEEIPRSVLQVNYMCDGKESISYILGKIIKDLQSEVKQIQPRTFFSRIPGTRRVKKVSLNFKYVTAEFETAEEPGKLAETISLFSSSVNELYKQNVFLRDCFIYVKIDEVDRLTPTIDMGAALKVLFDDFSDKGIGNMVFTLVGIAEDLSRFQRQHPSINRYFSIINLERFSLENCEEIVQRGLDNGEQVDFSKKQKEAIAYISEGFPDPVHQVSYELYEMARKSEGRLPFGALELALEKVLHEKRKGEFGESLTRIPTYAAESLLIHAATLNDNEFSLEELSEKSGVIQEECRKIVLTDLLSSFLERSQRSLYRFRDPLFRYYLRTSNFQAEWQRSKAEFSSEFLVGSSRVIEGAKINITKKELTEMEREVLENAFNEAILKNYQATGRARW